MRVMYVLKGCDVYCFNEVSFTENKGIIKFTIEFEQKSLIDAEKLL